jgi:hypothetical protein
MATPSHPLDAYRDDQLVVNLNELDEIDGLLGNLPIPGNRYVAVPYRVVDRIEPLNLALLQLTGTPGSFSDALSEVVKQELLDGARTQLDDLDFVPELDLLLLALRAANEGLTIGKNRDVDDVESSPHIGGEGDPEPLGPGVRVKFPPLDSPPRRPVHVGVLDSKYYSHPDLVGRVIAEPDALMADLDAERPSPKAHSVFVSGLIVQQAPTAQLIVRAVLGERGTASSWNVAKKMAAFLNGKVDILNMSFSAVTRYDDDEGPLVLRRAVETLHSAGIFLVAAAGNHGDPTQEQIQMGITRTTRSWPAAFPNVTAVGAFRADGEPGAYSPVGDWIDVGATAENEASTFLPRQVRIIRRRLLGRHDDNRGVKDFREGYATWGGSSGATAKVSGAIANIMATEDLSPDEAYKRLLDGSISEEIRPYPRP